MDAKRGFLQEEHRLSVSECRRECLKRRDEIKRDVDNRNITFLDIIHRPFSILNITFRTENRDERQALSFGPLSEDSCNK